MFSPLLPSPLWRDISCNDLMFGVCIWLCFFIYLLSTLVFIVIIFNILLLMLLSFWDYTCLIRIHPKCSQTLKSFTSLTEHDSAPYQCYFNLTLHQTFKATQLHLNSFILAITISFNIFITFCHVFSIFCQIVSIFFVKLLQGYLQIFDALARAFFNVCEHRHGHTINCSWKHIYQFNYDQLFWHLVIGSSKKSVQTDNYCIWSFG